MHLSNIDLLEEMFEKYKKDPSSLDPSWRYFFEGMEFGSIEKIGEIAKEDLAAFALVDAYRKFGHLKAKINPIATHPPEHPPQLKLANSWFYSSRSE